jgi:hypothetical protein
MRSPRARIACAVTAAALAVPSAALAQSAGDEQYDDPFGGEDQEQATPTPEPDTPVSSDDGTQATAQATPTPTPAPGSAAAAQEQLPRTGGDPLPFAVAGFWILLGGVALRAKVRVR